jgi:hypothetical protein
MSSIFPSSISNSSAAFEPFIGASGYYVTPFSVSFRYLEEMQSTSVTPDGFLWLQTLARIAYENPPTIPQNDLNKNEVSQGIAQSQKNRALIQLLRSWREGDEEEQQNTWEYLKQALDEDRLSERKLFP